MKIKRESENPMRYINILKHFRDRIVSGEFAAAGRLPLREDLLAQYDTSHGTLQKVVSALEAEGYVKNCGANGVCLVDTPPHLYRIGIVFSEPEDQTVVRWDPEFTSTMAACREFRELHPEYTLEIYYVSNYCRLDQQRLVDDCREHRLAGLLLLEGMVFPKEVREELKTLDFPVVDVGNEHLKTMHVSIDYMELLCRSHRRLVEAGCRRIAALRNEECLLSDLGSWERKYNFHIPDEWNLACGMASYSLAALPNLLKLLFKGSREERPDGLIILNEYIGSHMVPILKSMGLMDEPALKVVCHANFYGEAVSGVPYERIGYASMDFLDNAVKMIRDWNQGDRSGKSKLIHCVSEAEYLEQYRQRHSPTETTPKKA